MDPKSTGMLAELEAAVTAMQKAESKRATKVQRITAVTVERNENATSIILPDGMGLDTAIDWLRKQQQDEETEVQIKELFPVDPKDGAVICAEAMADVFGYVAQKPTPGFFGDTPPEMLTVFTSTTESVQVPWGRFGAPGIEGYLHTGAIRPNNKAMMQFALQGVVKKKSIPTVNRLVMEIRNRIAAGRSIFRGQAVDLDRNFLPITRIDTDDLILPKEVMASLTANLFTPITHTDSVTAAKIPLKRGVLLTGPYGVGKSLTATVTASLCRDNGWTFVMVKDPSTIVDALRFAAAYQPAVVFCEDIDTVASGERNDKLNDMLESVDGVLAKGSKVMVVLTTNHVERINPAMLRPGRLDAIIEFTKPDADAAARLLRRYTNGQNTDAADFDKVGEACVGLIPAVIAEVGSRAKLFSIARGDSDLTTDDLVLAATQLKQHQRLVDTPLADPVSAMKAAALTLSPVFSILNGVPAQQANQKIRAECGRCATVFEAKIGEDAKCPKCAWVSVFKVK